MDYTIGPKNQIKADRQQLYGSKTIMCPQRKLFYYFTNFSNKFINTLNLDKLETDLSEQAKTTPLTYVCLPKIEEHYLIMANLLVINITNPMVRHKIPLDLEYQIDIEKLMSRKARNTFKISTYFDMILIQDCELMIAIVLQIKQKGSCLLAVEYGQFNWFWTATRKLVGFSPTKNSFKMIDTLKKNTKNQQLEQ